MMSPTGSAIATPPSEPSCYEDRPAEDDDVDLGVPDPVYRLVGARDVRGAVTVAGAAFERCRVVFKTRVGGPRAAISRVRISPIRVGRFKYRTTRNDTPRHDAVGY